ncbi:MAG: hypothetical protein CSA95_01040 [Bacteroidetes bacterium]|nr:MAG: hypothetical protein CSA95_01040 [Bacteroidota bacterium]
MISGGLMQKSVRGLWLFIFVLMMNSLGAQRPYEEVDYCSPVDFRIFLNGTFGELRSGHFHSGLDIKTGGVSGKDIHAIGDGWVSRIKVSPTGYGNALYIAHPEGYTSVYAHLQSFESAIADFVLEEQYQKERFAIDIPVPKGKFTVKKGQVIAKSGNSGSSAGPHLHFEIRDTKTQHALNPLHFGFQVKDFIRPKITGLMVYPESEYTLVDGKNVARRYNVEGWGPVYRPVDYYKINVCGPFSIGVKAYDVFNDAHNKNGVYRYEMFVDDERLFGWVADKIAFSETRYINAFIDYATYVDKRERFVRTSIVPNNRLTMYDGENGVINFKTPGEHTVKFLAMDFAGDTSVLTMTFVASVGCEQPVVADGTEGGRLLGWDQRVHLDEEAYSLHIAPQSLFEDLRIQTGVVPLPEGIKGFSEGVGVGTRGQVSHKRFDLAIRCEEAPLAHREKLCLARLEGGNVIYAGGTYEKAFVKTKTRNFGTYFVTADTTAPEITPLNLALRNEKGYARSLRFRIKDDFSGIAEYNGYFNGGWVLFRYDAKNNLLYYRHDKYLPKGEIDVKIVVKDAKGNEALFERTIMN